MVAMLRAHPRGLMHRTCLALALAACLVGCLAEGTSLGGIESSSSAPDADGANYPSLPPGRASAAGGLGLVCHAYTWDPVPTTESCEYLLPSGDPPSDDPRLDPAAWNPHDVWVEIFPNETYRSWEDFGYHTSSRDGCAGRDGWYYVTPCDDAGESDADGGGAGAPTLFALCPKSCATVAKEGVLLRLTAHLYCE
jgi:hypothetical protein